MCKEKQSDERRNWCVFVYPPRVIMMHTRWSQIAFLSCTFLHCDVKSIVVRVCIKISLILRLTGYVGRNEYVISSIEESQHYFSFFFFTCMNGRTRYMHISLIFYYHCRVFFVALLYTRLLLHRIFNGTMSAPVGSASSIGGRVLRLHDPRIGSARRMFGRLSNIKLLVLVTKMNVSWIRRWDMFFLLLEHDIRVFFPHIQICRSL